MYFAAHNLDLLADQHTPYRDCESFHCWTVTESSVGCRVVFQAGLNIRADAAELSAKTTAATTPPTDLTQAIAVAGFLLVRFGKGSFDVDPGLILKSLASLQLLVAAVALLTRGVHSDRVSFFCSCTHPSSAVMLGLLCCL